MTSSIFNRFRGNFNFDNPPDIISWAGANVKLPHSSQAGFYDADYTPFLKQVLISMTDPNVRDVIICGSAQFGKTEMIVVFILYMIKHLPTTMIFTTSTDELADNFSRLRLDPVVKESGFYNIYKDDEFKTKKTETLKNKIFPGGWLTIATANSVSALSSKSAEIIIADELSLWDKKGNVILLENRKKTFQDTYKKIYLSTPTIEGQCLITNEYKKTNQQKYYVPCPNCKHKQVLVFKNLKYKEVQEPVYICENCKKPIEEKEKKRMVLNGEWVETSHKVKSQGFWINDLYSPFVSWNKIAEDFVNSKAFPEMLRNFINLSLGETWNDNNEGKTFEIGIFDKKIIQYNDYDVPQDGLILVAGVDTQDDRVEGEIVAYGLGYSTWGVKKFVIWGRPDTKVVWDELYQILTKNYKHESGVDMQVRAVCIDSGGHYTDYVYGFCKEHERRRWYAVKGLSRRDQPVLTFSKQRIKGIRLGLVGTDTVKTRIYNRFNIDEGEGSMWFPDNENYNDNYFRSLTSEKLVTKKDNSGYTYTKWVLKKGERNEALDCRVYSEVAIEIIKPDFERLAEDGVHTSIPVARKQRRVISAGI